MWYVVFILFFWFLPMVVCTGIAENQQKCQRWTFFWSFLGGWIGGGFALLLLKPDEEALEAAELEADREYLDKKRKAVAPKLSEEEYRRLMGGSREKR